MAFQVTFAGVPFAVDTADVLTWIDREMPVSQELFGLPPPNPWNGTNTHGLLGDTLPPYPRLRIGDWFYPWGARRWSVFHGLAAKSQVASMMAAALPGGGSPVTQPFTYQADADGNAGVDAQNYQLQTNLWMLPPRVFAFHDPGGSTSKGEPLYLVTLVDDRYWFPQRAGASNTFHFPAGSTTTWDNLLNAIQTVLSISLTWPTVNSVYGDPEPDSDLYSNYENPAVLLDACAANLGCAVVRNLDGTYQLLPHAGGGGGVDSVTYILANRPSPVQRTAGGNMLSQPSIGPDDSAGPNAETAALPNAVRVTFPKFQLPGAGATTPGIWLNLLRPSSTWIQDSYDDVWAEIVTATQAGVANPDGISNNTWTLHDTCKALYTTGMEATPVNETALRSLAVQMARDFYNAAVMGLDETYPGTLNWQMEGLHDVLYSYRGSTGQALTRLLPRPWNYGPVEFQHELNTRLTCPTMTALITVTDAFGAGGFPCQWNVLDPDTLALPSVNDANGAGVGWAIDVNDANLATGSTYLGRLAGVRAADGKPVWAVVTTQLVPVRIVSGTPDANGVYTGKIDVVASATPSISDVTDCYFWDPNMPGALNANDYFLALFLGNYTGVNGALGLYVRDDFHLQWLTSAGAVGVDHVNQQQIGQDTNLVTDDFIVTNPSARVAKIRTNGLNINVQYCDTDGTIHTLYFCDGLLKGRT